MPIGFQSTTAQLITGKSMATTWDILCALPLPPNWVESICSCPCIETCCKDEYAFHDSVGTDNYTNDKSSWLFRKEVTGDGDDIKLYKKGGPIGGYDITSSLGALWTWGAISTYDTEEEYSGFCLDWFLVYMNYGNGNYTLKGTITRQGVTKTYESHCFLVRPFSCDIAKDTIKIQTIQNGMILSESVNLTGFNWYQSIRINGKLFRQTPKMVVENFINGSRVVQQIQDQIIDEYFLELWPMPNAVKNQIVYSMSMSNEIWISDYNVNQERYDQVRLYTEEIPLVKSWSNNPDSRVNLKMKPKVQDIIKRNFARNYVPQSPLVPPVLFVAGSPGAIEWEEGSKILWGPDPGQYIAYTI